ncbi:MAG: hypothetical protein ACLFNN_00395 [Candidatus Paceibacterota bacterium]
MAKDNKNLNFDLDFLDEESPVEARKKATKKRPRGPLLSAGARDGIKKWSTGIAVVIGIIFFIALFSDDSSTSSNYTSPTSNQNSSYSNENDLVRVGEYMCSQYHANRADELEPSDLSLSIEQSSLESRGNEIDRLANELQYSTVNEYSPQWQIDEYNEKVDEYNRKLAAYNRDVDNMQLRIDGYNRKVEIYNNYLIENCTPNR